MRELMEGGSLTRRLAGAVVIGCVFIAAALYLGYRIDLFGAGASLVGTTLILEAQPGAVAAVALGFPPRTAAATVILANLAPLPFLTIGLEEILNRWPWVQRKLLRARNWASRFRQIGPLIFIPLSPFVGAYAATAIGRSLGFRPVRTLWATVAGMVWSVVAITYGGHWVAHLLIH